MADSLGNKCQLFTNNIQQGTRDLTNAYGSQLTDLLSFRSTTYVCDRLLRIVLHTRQPRCCFNYT